MRDARKSANRRVATDEIAHDVDATARRCFKRRLRDVVRPVVDREVGSELSAQLELLGAARSRDHPSTERRAELDRRRADSARARMDEHRLSGLEVAPLDQREVGDVECEEECGGPDVVEAVRGIERHVGVSEHLLRVRSERAGRGSDDAPSEPILGSLARTDYLAHDFHPKCVWERRVDRAIPAEAAVDLVEVQRRRRGLDDQLTGTRGWLLHLIDV